MSQAAPLVMHSDDLTVRPMQPDDAAMVMEMARELAAAVDDPVPALSEFELVKDGFGPERWFDCLAAEIHDQLVGYAVVCRAFEAHTGKKNAFGLGIFMCGPLRAAVAPGVR